MIFSECLTLSMNGYKPFLKFSLNCTMYGTNKSFLNQDLYFTIVNLLQKNVPNYFKILQMKLLCHDVIKIELEFKQN